jgi:hypothetical protein
MASRLLIRAIVTTVNHETGYEEWVEDGPEARGLIDGGYFEVVQRVGSRSAAPVKADKAPAASDGGHVDAVDQA